MAGVEPSEEYKKDIQKHMRKFAGPTVYLEIIMFTEALPKASYR